MKNVLVTGGAGFIGSNFIEYILKKNKDVNIYNLDALTYAGNVDNLDFDNKERHSLIIGNICDKHLVGDIFDKYKIDSVVHFAAETHVDRSINDSSKFIETNVVGTSVLLDVAKNFWGSWQQDIYDNEYKFLAISTDEVFGTLDMRDMPFHEKSLYQPRSPYSATKAASDHLVMSYHHTYGFPSMITHCTNNYGKKQHPEKLIPMIITRAMEGKEIPVYGDGKQIRNWIYVDDHCEALYEVLTEGRVGYTYGIGGDNQVKNINIIKKICTMLDGFLPKGSNHFDLVKGVEDRLGHDRRYDMNTCAIKTELGWYPKTQIDNGLRKTVEWYLNKNGVITQ